MNTKEIIKQGNFVIIPRAYLLDQKLTTADKMVLIAIRSLTFDANAKVLSITNIQISSIAGIHRSGVPRILDRLVKYGYLIYTENGYKKNIELLINNLQSGVHDEKSVEILTDCVEKSTDFSKENCVEKSTDCVEKSTQSEYSMPHKRNKNLKVVGETLKQKAEKIDKLRGRYDISLISQLEKAIAETRKGGAVTIGPLIGLYEKMGTYDKAIVEEGVGIYLSKYGGDKREAYLLGIIRRLSEERGHVVNAPEKKNQNTDVDYAMLHSFMIVSERGKYRLASREEAFARAARYGWGQDDYKRMVDVHIKQIGSREKLMSLLAKKINELNDNAI